MEWTLAHWQLMTGGASLVGLLRLGWWLLIAIKVGPFKAAQLQAQLEIVEDRVRDLETIIEHRRDWDSASASSASFSAAAGSIPISTRKKPRSSSGLTA